MKLDMTKISNLSPSEMFNYCDIPAEVEDMFFKLTSELEQARADLKQAERDFDAVYEQCYFAKEVIVSILEESRKTPKAKLSKEIDLIVENSYVEL